MAVTSGCSASSQEPEPSPAAILRNDADAADHPSLASTHQEHDFGPVLAHGQTLRHEFTFSNPDPTSLRLLGAKAYTPCCSAIGPLPESIAPHGDARIPVLLKAGRRTGRSRVEFAVQTDSAQRPLRMLALRALLVAEWEMREVGEASGFVPAGQCGKRTFRIVCHRRDDQGRDAPDFVDVSRPLSARFVGAPVETPRGDGLIETARDVEVTLPATTEPGQHRGELLIRWADDLIERHLFAWQVVPRIRAAPSGLTVKLSEDATRSVVLTSDDRPFRIIEVSGPLVAGSFRPPEGSARVHRIRLTLDLKKPHEASASDIRFTTDHPEQSNVTVSVLVMPGSEGGVE
jgi:hypothetical protein